ncbi:hypothetical protein ACQUQU_04240 [Thalassolituus sp. LLYu03]|uniref:hypothetical protein n=1 Tax=Thalassolituus sp. LLYu03 TaxID=3421656 RepID=UPI003D2A7623
MITWLIVGAVVMSLFGSIYWLKPSARDTRLAKLRFEAIRAGLQIRQFTFKPESAKNGVRDEVPGTTYTLLRAGKQQGGDLKFRIVGQKGWDAEGLPEGYSWHDQGTAADAERFKQALAAVKDHILLLEVYDNRVTLMAAEGKEATADAYKSFLSGFL